jgi:hypothetical protein
MAVQPQPHSHKRQPPTRGIKKLKTKDTYKALKVLTVGVLEVGASIITTANLGVA